MGNKIQGKRKYDRIRDDVYNENMIAFEMMLLSRWAPTTLVEYNLNIGSGNNQDLYDISIIDGFNISLSLTASGPSCVSLISRNVQCPDSYLFPFDNTKTHSFHFGTNYKIIFFLG